MKTLIRRVAVVLGAAAALRCSSEQLSQRLVELSAERASGEVATDDVRVEFVSVPAGPLAGDVSIDVTLLWAELPLAFELHYDYESGDVTTDGHGARLTLRSSRVLADAVERLSQELGPDNSELPLHAQMLFAALVVLAESGGIPLTPMTFRTDGGDMPDATTVPSRWKTTASPASSAATPTSPPSTSAPRRSSICPSRPTAAAATGAAGRAARR
ncbi:MAG TPA: hypothetical protein VNN80_24495 [Polyangiaceae bacterium]|nr:hypothetical protein [Polyangiaceae bacterium]